MLRWSALLSRVVNELLYIILGDDHRVARLAPLRVQWGPNAPNARTRFLPVEAPNHTWSFDVSLISTRKSP